MVKQFCIMPTKSVGIAHISDISAVMSKYRFECLLRKFFSSSEAQHAAYRREFS